MKRIFVAAAIAIATTVGAFAQVTGHSSIPGVVAAQPDAGMTPQVGVSPVPIVVNQAPAQQASSGGVIQLSAFGWLEPYVDSVVQAAIVGALSWIFYLLQKYFNIKIDQGHRDALTTFLQNRASSLIADGAVRMQGTTVHVDSAALATAVASINDGAQDAAKHFGLTPAVVEAKIIDAIPQTPAGATIVAAAAPNAPEPSKPETTGAEAKAAAAPQPVG